MTTATRQPTIEVRLLEEIEGTLAIDCAPAPDIIAPLVARADAHRDAYRNPDQDERLVADTYRALDGEWLYLDEIHAIQQLRGWHRARSGRITVDGERLWAVYRVLGNLTLSLSSECEQGIHELEDPGLEDELAAAQASMEATGYCGECRWCTVMRLRSECGRELHAAGYEMGIEYRMNVLGQSCDQANREMYG